MNKKELLGKKVYSYSLYNDNVILKIHEITEVDEEKAMVLVDNVYRVYLDSIGNTTRFARQWFTFERNDKQAKAILYGYEMCNFSMQMDDLLNKIETLKKIHENNLKSIEKDNTIMKDEESWKKFGKKE